MPKTATAVAPTAKELRRKAKNLDVRNWEEMDREQLAAAIAEKESSEESEEAPARRTRKATATKATTTKTKAAASKPAKTAPASKKATKAAPAKATATKGKKAAPRPAAAADTGPNPFRAGTNLWHFTEALMVGGKRSALVKKLLPKVTYNPRVQEEADFDAEAETDRRLKVIGYILKNQHGWEYQHEGRGPDAFIKATPPA